jgi:hypothetical protein
VRRAPRKSLQLMCPLFHGSASILHQRHFRVKEGIAFFWSFRIDNIKGAAAPRLFDLNCYNY